jgi:hypothetical protein
MNQDNRQALAASGSNRLAAEDGVAVNRGPDMSQEGVKDRD